MAITTSAPADELGDGPAKGPETASLFRKLRAWIERDMEAMTEWRKEARECFDFYAGNQWDEAERAFLKEQNRPAITFEQIGPMVRAVTGMQSQNRQEVQYLARGLEDDPFAEIWTLGGKWFDDRSDGNDADDEAFEDTCICGLGFTESRLDYDLHIDGEPARDRVDTEEMLVDFNAKKRNLADARRFTRRKDMTLGEAKAMFPDADPADLDAAWLRDGFGEVKSGGSRVNRNSRYENSGTTRGEDDELDDDDIVTIGLVCWWQREKRKRVGDRILKPAEFDDEVKTAEDQLGTYTDHLGTMTDDPAADPQALAMAAQEIERVRGEIEATRSSAEDTTERVYYEAFVGMDVLEKKEAPLQKGFRFRAITGYRDQNKRMFFGLVRAMLGPQKMANKWLTTMSHINDKSAQGGIMMEVDAADDVKKFERDFNKSDKISWLATGGIGKIQPKPSPAFPSQYIDLTNFATRSIRLATGISEETQGMREANQPGVLEQMRKEQTVATMAGLFKSMSRYRKEMGATKLELLRRWVSPERMSLIVGAQFAEVVPAAYESMIDYDVIVDETATSPNQKSLVWQLISGIFSSLPIQVQREFWAYSPLPASAVGKIQAGYDAAIAAQAPPPEDQALSRQQQQADVNATIANTQRSMNGG